MRFRPLWGSFLFLLKMNIKTNVKEEQLFPSPMGIFFISILSYGNLTGHRENPHFAVQKVFSGKIGGFEAF